MISNRRITLVLTSLCLALTSLYVSADSKLQDSQKVEQLEQFMSYLGFALAAATSDQKLINDPEVGDKGITANKVVATANTKYKEKLGSEFMNATGVDVYAQGRLALQESIREIVNEAQSSINAKGVGFKSFIPAVFRSKVSLKFNEKMLGKMRFHATAPQGLLRNRKHRPDAWEDKVMYGKFMLADYPKNQSYSESTMLDGKAAFRYIKPMYYGETCLSCHGDKKGEPDISGYPKEGAKLEDFAGAMSFTVYE